jgi:hypothetical protein
VSGDKRNWFTSRRRREAENTLVALLIGDDMKAIASLLLIVSSVAPSGDAYAQVFRCVDAEGHTVFSDTSCGTHEEKVQIVESSGGLSAITGDGLTSQEKSQLGAAEARAAAQAAAQPSSGGGSAPAPAASSPEPARRTY